MRSQTSGNPHRRTLRGLLAVAAVVATTLAMSPGAFAQDELEGSISFLHKYGDPRYTPYFESVVAAY